MLRKLIEAIPSFWIEILLVLPAVPALAVDNDCSRFQLYIPSGGSNGGADGNAGYSMLFFEPDPNVVLVYRGEYARARQMNFHSYTTDSPQVHDFITDYQIQPDPGSTNPFLPGNALAGEPRRYTVRFVPFGSAKSTNTVEIPNSGGSAIWYRYYAPFDGEPIAFADLPKISSYDLQGNPVPCPPMKAPNPAALLASFATVGADFAKVISRGNELGFYRYGAASLFANRDNGYLTAIHTPELQSVTVIRFRSPRFLDPRATALFVEEEVRYWSLCLASGIKGTCLKDVDVPLDDAGYATIAIAPPELESAVRSLGMAFLPRTSSFESFYYRNLVTRPGFAGDVRAVPDQQLASLYIAEYAPAGLTCTVEQFKTTNCGMPLPSRRVQAPRLAVGAAYGAGPHVREFSATGSTVPGPLTSYYAFDPASSPGVSVASADLDLDGVADHVAGSAPGSPSRAAVRSGRTGALLVTLDLSAESRTGLYVASADVTGDGRREVIVSGAQYECDSSGWCRARVRIFDPVFSTLLAVFSVDETSLASCLSVSPESCQGTEWAGWRVTAADLDGDGVAEIAAAKARGGSTVVRVFRGNGTLVRSFAPYGGWQGGAYLAAGDIDGDGRDDLVTGADRGAGPHVKVFGSGDPSNVLMSFLAFDASFTGGVRVSALADTDGDGRDELIVAASSGAGPHVLVIGGMTGRPIGSFFAFDPGFTGGIFVGGYLE